jgi:hypothetical protein
VKSVFRISLLTILFSFSAKATVGLPASKIDNVVEVIRHECHRDVSQEEALGHLRQIYLVCVPDTKVKVIDGCSVKCMKNNNGVVMGR